MVQQVEVRVWCDAHHLAGEQVPGAAVRVALTGALRELDLCQECREKFIEPLAELLKRQGRPVTEAQSVAPAKTGNRGGRPRKGETAEEAAARRAAGAVLQQDVPLPGMDERVFYVNPDTSDTRVRCPLCENLAANLDALRQHVRMMHETTVGTLTGLTCPCCGQEVGRGLGNHTGTEHSCDVLASFDLAVELGDPYGVVAMARHRWQELAAAA